LDKFWSAPSVALAQANIKAKGSSAKVKQSDEPMAHYLTNYKSAIYHVSQVLLVILLQKHVQICTHF
jgi:hypothetical protein